MDNLTHHKVKLHSCELHVIEAGKRTGDSIILLHGWPEDWTEWRGVIERASQTHHVVAFDLPGVGESHGLVAGGTKAAIAESIHEAIQQLGLKQYAVVGHDVGAMVAYSYLKKFSTELTAAVLMSSVIPGVEPWSKVLANPYIWHFAFHNTPKLPEILVNGHQRIYFDHFFDILTKDPTTISDKARAHYAAAYGTPEALQAGFDWYRGFSEDAKTNSSDTSNITTPVLYLRGEFEGEDLEEYAAGFRQAGLTALTTARISGSGHYSPEENPDAVWGEIAKFFGEVR